MMKGILNAVRLQVQRAMASMISSRFGSITNFDPNTFTARVMLQPDNVMTGWLQVSCPWIGNGWGMFAPPNIGDLVDVLYTNSDLQSGVIALRSYNQVNRPLPVKSGEFWLVHKSGAFFKLTNDGKLSVSDGHGATVTLNGDGSITSAANKWTHTGEMDITGTVNITGNASVSQTLIATTDVVGGGISLKNHKTTLVQPGTGLGGPPV
jgi:phage baseplate assembly protein V